MPWGYYSKTVFGSTHLIKKKIPFSMILFILTFGFDLFMGSFFTFWSPYGLFLGSRYGSETIFGSSHVANAFFYFL